MSYKYRASANLKYTDHDTAQEAVAVVEAAGSGSIVLFRMEPNRPDYLPKLVARSCAMWCFEDGEWWSHYIFDGRGGRLKKERPT